MAGTSGVAAVHAPGEGRRCSVEGRTSWCLVTGVFTLGNIDICNNADVIPSHIYVNKVEMPLNCCFYDTGTFDRYGSLNMERFIYIASVLYLKPLPCHVPYESNVSVKGSIRMAFHKMLIHCLHYIL